MTLFESLTLIASVAAVAAALAAIWSNRSIARRQHELEAVTAELSRRQLEQIEVSEQAAQCATWLLDLSYRDGLTITNLGPAVARNVAIENAADLKFLSDGDYADKFPATTFHPGHEIRLVSGFHMGIGPKWSVTLTWEDGRGDVRETFDLVAS